MWGGAQEKSGGHIKKISAGAAPALCPPHLQIASDATVTGYKWENKAYLQCLQQAAAAGAVGVTAAGKRNPDAGSRLGMC